MDRLFHYTSINTLKKILENNTIKFNNIIKVNDPHESKSFNIYDIEEELFKRFNFKSKFYSGIINLKNEIEILEDEMDIKKSEYKEAVLFKEKEKAKNYKIKIYEIKQKIEIIRKKYIEHLAKKSNYDIIKLSDNDKYSIRIPNSFNPADSKFSKRKYNKLKNTIVKTACFCTGYFNINEFNKENIHNKRQGFFYPRMWAQYANKSSGCCIIFKKDILDTLFNKLSDKYYLFSGKIKYLDILNIDHIYNLQKLIFPIHRFKNENEVIKFLRENHHLLFFCKDKDWKDEKEYRYLIIDKNYNNLEPYFMKIENAVDSVIFGEKCKSDLNDIIKKCIKERINLYRIKNYLGKYYLDDIKI
jgi:hypothetical protein